MLPFLEEEIQKVVKALMESIVKPERLGSSLTLTELLSIDLDKEENLLDCKKVSIGLAAKEVLSRLQLSEALVREFKSQCRKCYVLILKKLKERFSNDTVEFLSKLSSLNPSYIVDHPNRSVAKFEDLVIGLIQKKLVLAEKGDGIVSQYKEVNRKVRSEQKHTSLNFQPTNKSIDVFYYEIIGGKSEYNGKLM